MGDEYPRAVVREIDGQLVLDDPDALAMIRAVSKHNCKGMIELNIDRIEHFCTRIKERGQTGADVVIVLLNVNDPVGRLVTEILMPGQDAMWQDIRDKGEIPVARGLASREGVQQMLEDVDPDAAEKLKTIDGIAVVVLDHDVAEAYAAKEI